MKKLNIHFIVLSYVISSGVYAEDWAEVLKSVNKNSSHTLENSASAISDAKKLLENGKTLKAGELTQVLVQRLGITEQQATGGAGALLQIAKTRMNPEAFAKLSQQVPDISPLLSAVPVLHPQSGLGGLAGKLGGLAGGSSVGSALTAVSLFQQLGMKPETMQKFVPVVVDYVRGNTGDALAKGLGTALSLEKK